MSLQKWSLVVFFMFVLSGCAALHDSALPLNDEILFYELPYDLTYLRAMEASMETPGWELEETDKEKGIIRVRNLQFSRFDDSDQRMVTLLLDRESGTTTSIQLSPESQRVIGGNLVLETVARYVSRELR